MAGVIGSGFAARLRQGMLYGVPAADPWTFAAALSILTAVTFLAAWIPARHAARIDPVEALRQE